jgi:raffinose/stachyose/melibiose transport system substrate-binding protein
MARNRVLSAVALTAGVAMLAACGGGGSDTASEGSEGGDTTLTWWHNSNAEPGKGVYRTSRPRTPA